MLECDFKDRSPRESTFLSIGYPLPGVDVNVGWVLVPFVIVIPKPSSLSAPCIASSSSSQPLELVLSSVEHESSDTDDKEGMTVPCREWCESCDSDGKRRRPTKILRLIRRLRGVVATAPPPVPLPSGRPEDVGGGGSGSASRKSASHRARVALSMRVS